MTTTSDCWGPYRSSVGDHLASCEDYLDRLRRSYSGELAPDRLYFAEKAHELRDAAQALVDFVDDTEWWLGACTVQFVHERPDDDAMCVVDCGRAAGHSGGHLEDGRCPEQLVLAEVRSVSSALRHVTDRLAWGLLTVRANAEVTDAQTLAGELRQVEGRLAAAVPRLASLGVDEAAGVGRA